MKSQSLLPATQNKAIVKVGTPKNSQPKSVENLQTYEQGLEKMWQMFQTQLQRNFDLMSLVTKQQQQIEQLVSGTLLQPHVPAQSPKEAAPLPIQKIVNQSTYQDKTGVLCNAMPSLPYENLLDLKENFIAVFYDRPKRLDAVFSIINFLHFLYLLDGEASRDELLRKTSLSVSSLQRYSDFLIRNSLISYQGKRNSNGIYRVTTLGKMFLKGEITSNQQFLEESAKHKIALVSNIKAV